MYPGSRFTERPQRPIHEQSPLLASREQQSSITKLVRQAQALGRNKASNAVLNFNTDGSPGWPNTFHSDWALLFEYPSSLSVVVAQMRHSERIPKRRLLQGGDHGTAIKVMLWSTLEQKLLPRFELRFEHTVPEQILLCADVGRIILTRAADIEEVGQLLALLSDTDFGLQLSLATETQKI